MGTRWQDLNKTRWTDWYGAIEDARGDLTARCRTIFAGGLSMGACWPPSSRSTTLTWRGWSW